MLAEPEALAQRTPAVRDDAQASEAAHGMGRELFAGLRRNVRGAEDGAISWL